MSEIVKCKKCGGVGRHRSGPCVTCKGSGAVLIRERGGQKVVSPAPGIHKISIPGTRN